MSLSFEDSLKNNEENTEAANNEIIVEDLESNDMSAAPVMAYSMRSAAVMADTLAEAEDWERVPNASSYKYYNDEYSDVNFSTIDESKNIILDPSQFNITQEKNSQYIPFQIPRYYDGFDLTKTKLGIYYVNKNKDSHTDIPVDVYYNDNYIRFAWLVSEFATQVAGILQFEIHAVGANSKGEPYTWKSKSIDKLNVLQSLEDVALGEIGLGEEEIQSWYNQIVAASTDAINASISAQRYAEEAAETYRQLQDGIADEVQSTINETVAEIVDGAIADQLEDYYTKTETYNKDEIDEKIAEVKPKGYATEDYVEDKLGSLVDLDGNPLTVAEYVTQEVANVDISDQIGELGEHETVTDYVNAAVAAVDVSEQLQDYAKSADVYTKTETYNKDEIDNALDNISLDDYYNKKAVDDKLTPIATDVETNKGDITNINTKIAEINQDIANLESSSNISYKATYGDVETDDGILENMFTLWEVHGAEGETTTETVRSRFKIEGGSSGTVSSTKPVIEYVTLTPYVVTTKDKAIIYYNFTDTDASGNPVPEATATWSIGQSMTTMKKVATETIEIGENLYFDATDYLITGKQLIKVEITDVYGGYTQGVWSVKRVDIRLDDNDVKFDDTKPVVIGNDLELTYVVWGDIAEKYVHFILDGEPLDTVQVTTSGDSKKYKIPAQEHGSHLLKMYMTATIDKNTISTEPVYRDIIWYDENSTKPVIGTRYQEFTAKQYDTTEIEYTVYDPNTNYPKVEIAVDGEVVSSKTMDKATDSHSFKTDKIGTHIITITCGEGEDETTKTVKTLKATIEDLGIQISPVIEGWVFDFNPVGKSNKSEQDKNWTDGSVTMSVSDNFDWINGGWQTDTDTGDQYFCVKAGTTATINYNLFGNDARINGKEFKVIFKTTNVKKRDTSFIECMNGGIGLDMKVENANIHLSDKSMHTPYCENDIIEFDFNIYAYDTEKTFAQNIDFGNMPLILTFEDGTPSTPMEYTVDGDILSSFWQGSPQPITIGSEDCDTYIYRMRVYEKSLSDSDILKNFIADARSAEEMIDRHNRNQIYTNGNLVSTSASGDFSAEALMKAAPDLRYIFLEAPRFTYKKSDKVDNCNVYFRYPAGTRPEDNWDCTGMRHRGQGTSSDSYGDAGRNIDLCMDRDTSEFVWKDEEGKEVKSKTITLTDTSVPTDYLNIKVNIASSENANNAEMARRFNQYQPFLRYARKKDSKVKDTMEFYNCVVFIREMSTDSANYPHQEFNDTNWHFYAIGNVGDSKKTDDTRVNNASDPKEHIIEIMDVDKPLSSFPTGKAGNAICPVDEWKAGNTAYDVLHSTDYVYEDGEFKSFAGTTYEFRYEKDGIEPEDREVNINTWRNLYKFIATSTDAEFYAHLKDYFVVDSALYYYLFTERYTMVDNRCKNSFWHYGKVYISTSEANELGETEASYYIIDDAAAAINEGYRYDLTFGYDFDTALGIDNTGDFVFPYGKEDTDYYVDEDPTSDYVFRVADSTFFCRLRDLFPSEMQRVFKECEAKNAWSSTSLVNQWDNSQKQFPEDLWRKDYIRKYRRPYTGLSDDNSIPKSDKTFLIGKFFGRKKYSRRAFENDQEIYFATKYFGDTALKDVFWFRGNVPIGSSIPPNYSLTLVPYSDMYLCVQYGSASQPIHSIDEETSKPKRIKAGKSYTFTSDADRMDFIYVYAASRIQEVGDLSRCYIGDNNFSMATRLQKLEIGSTDDGYENTFMEKILISNNPLLEYLDLRNISGLTEVINVSGCPNLRTLYAEGTNATGVAFADGGNLEIAHLPRVKSLSMKNLSKITDFVMEKLEDNSETEEIDESNNYALESLIVENTSAINTYDLVNNSPSLFWLRLVGMNWDRSYGIQDSSILDRALLMRGRNNSGSEISQSVLAGNFHSATIKQRQLDSYGKAWSDLEISYDTKIEQYPVIFKNADGDILETQYVDKGQCAIDPTKRVDNPLSPTIPSTVSHQFAFDNWKQEGSDIYFDFNTKVFDEIVLVACYAESLREYTIKYVSKDVTMQESTGLYGENVPYTGITPTYIGEEEGYVYHLFNRWDKSGFLLEGENGTDLDTGVKTVEAIFDRFVYNAIAFDDKELKDLSPVEIYAMNKLNLAESIITNKDPYSFTIGNDIDYDDIKSELLISEKTSFTGSNYVDTGIQLFDEDKDFVLAIDYEFLDGNTANAVLAQCFQANGSNGFKLGYNSGVKFTWGTTSDSVTSINKREIIVVRHKKGDNNLTIYKSNLDGDEVVSSELTRAKSTIGTGTLVFGSARADDGIYENHAIGNINWAKVWFADLGDDVCKDLAMWTHESITLEACGFRKYYLSENTSKRCSFSLLASHLLGRTKQWNTTNSNDGGWKSSALNTSLNKRLYNAMPTQIKSLLKQVIVYSGDGISNTDGSFYTEVIPANCYITIPALIEVDSSHTLEPYNSEGSAISYMSNNDARKRAFDGGDYNAYWTRSPNASFANYVWSVDKNGGTQGITPTPNTNAGVLIEISF